MVSTQAMNAKTERLSFAAIAAAGIKPSKVSSTAMPSPGVVPPHAQKTGQTDGSTPVIASSAPLPNMSTSKPKRLVQLTGRNTQELRTADTRAQKLQIETPGNSESSGLTSQAPEILLAPVAEDTGTVVSSSDGDGKPHSLDGKSQASATTFALDEKDSLRPDDSASVQAAVEDDEIFTATEGSTPSSRPGTDNVAPPFQGQLHEINAMEPSRHQQVGSSVFGSRGTGVLYVPPQGLGLGVLPEHSRSPLREDDNLDLSPDPKLLEALENPRDRIWVLKLEQDVIDFVKDTKESSLVLPQCHSFYRLLAHKIADYYVLGHAVDDSSNAVRLYKTPGCRIPPPLTGIVTPSTAASTPPPSGPQMKILRRGDGGPAIANGSNMTSSANSESGEDDKKKPATREEREARYEAARLRIMGSAKPAEVSDSKDSEVSRSNSAAGKKKKKQLRDNDDDFQARSAYSSYYTPSNPAAPYQMNTVAFPNAPLPTVSVAQPPMLYGAQQGFFPEYMGQPTQQWSGGAYPSQSVPQQWSPSQSQGYDMADHFAQAMMMQPQAGGRSPSNGQMYPQPSDNMPTAWSQLQQQQQSPHMMPTGRDPMSPVYSSGPVYSDRLPLQPHSASQANFQHQQPPSVLSQAQAFAQGEAPSQAYPFGRLPSQALGRPPNALEHPLPGSYKSPHFNPQSQAFVPGQGGNSGFRPFTPKRGPSANATNRTPYNLPYSLDRQISNTSQSPSVGSPHQNSYMNLPAQPLTHPLPQPVFPRQASPNMSLPPKPMSGAQGFNEQMQYGDNCAMASGQSSIAKWGTPASLPPKPPPPAEPFDLQQNSRMAMASYAAPRHHGSGAPGCGFMPPLLANGTGVVMNGGNVPGARRV